MKAATGAEIGAMGARLWHVPALALITLAGLAVHGWSLGDGLFLDDHWHRYALMKPGWSWSRLIDDATIEPGRFMESWWQDRPVRWQYTRPAALALMKGVYELSGGDPSPQHAVSIGLHVACAWMVYGLCFMLTGRRGWSAVGGMIFAAYSHATIAVAWLAAQNAILQTALTLGAMLAYVRASGLRMNCALAVRCRSRLFLDGRTETVVSWPSTSGTGAGRYYRNGLPADGKSLPATAAGAAPRVLRGWYFTSVVLWAAAVLSRENALVLPVMLAGLDLAFGGRHWLRARIAAYAPFVLFAAVFVVWRLTASYYPMPDVYFRKYDGPEYIGWYLVKLLHYVCSSVWLSPMTIGPSGRYNPLAETPGDCLLMLGIVGFMGVGYWLACRRIAGWWLWPTWIVLSVLPVTPLMATPHSGYMPAVGFATAMAIGPGLRREARPVGMGKWSPGVAIYFLVATHVYFPIYRALQMSLVAAERVTMEAVARYGPPGSAEHPEQGPEGIPAGEGTRKDSRSGEEGIPAGPGTRRDSRFSDRSGDGVGTAHPTGVVGTGQATDLFFINLPFVNIYAHTCLREAWGEAADGIRCHALTYAPNLLSMDQPFRIRQLDERRFELSTEGRPYFSGFLGRFLLNGMRCGGVFHAGQAVSGEWFDVEIVEGGAEGVSKLVFAFREPLASPRFRFFVSSSACPAAPMRFATAEELASPPAAGFMNNQESLLLMSAGGMVELFEPREPAGAARVRHVLAALGGPRIDPRGDTGDEWRELAAWWRNHVVLDAGATGGAAGERLAELLAARDGMNVIRGNASWIIRTDLYLTGPPYPGPR